MDVGLELEKGHCYTGANSSIDEESVVALASVTISFMNGSQVARPFLPPDVPHCLRASLPRRRRGRRARAAPWRPCGGSFCPGSSAWCSSAWSNRTCRTAGWSRQTPCCASSAPSAALRASSECSHVRSSGIVASREVHACFGGLYFSVASKTTARWKLCASCKNRTSVFYSLIKLPLLITHQEWGRVMKGKLLVGPRSVCPPPLCRLKGERGIVCFRF